VIYICIPVYNEERTVGVVLWKIRQVMAEFGRDYEVLIVDDGSTDGTEDVMAPYARIMPVHVRRHERRLGYARSMEFLLREAVGRSAYPKRDVVVTLQADFTDEPDDVAHLVKRVEGGVDVVTGRLRVVGSETPRMVRWSKRVWYHLLRRLWGSDQEGDMLSGMRAYRVITLRKAMDATGAEPFLTTDGWAANAELLQKTLAHARRSEAVDVQVRYGRLQRPSRFRAAWTARQLLGLLRSRGLRGAAPAPAEAAGETGLGEDGDRTGSGGRGGRPARTAT
jgi:glycosyltransferase involved in cell wall biosynthesis